MTQIAAKGRSGNANDSELDWFKGKEFRDLFRKQKDSKTALAHLGFDEPRGRYSIAAIIGFALLSITLASFLFTYFVPKEAARCYSLEIKFPLSVTGPGIGTSQGKICPDRAVTVDWMDRVRASISPDLPQVFSNLCVLVAIFIAIHQWRVTRSHAAFSEAFARKVTSNQTIMGEPEKLGPFISAAQAGGRPDSGEAAVVSDIFIYMEIDNLEYVFEKYRDEEISPKSALRQCFIFVSRCGNEDFRRKVVEFSSRGFYRPEFGAAVRRIAQFSCSPSSAKILEGRMANS